MNIRKYCRSALAGIGLVIATSGAYAAFVDFVEAVVHTDPVVVTTNIVLGTILTTSESASVTGLHHPGISPSPIVPGKRAAVLFEPGSAGAAPNVVSDYVLLTVGVIRADAVFGLAQDLLVEFFSQDILLNDLLVQLSADGFTFGGGPVEDGSLQDLSLFLGTLPEGLIVRALSHPGEVPEPSSLALLGLALAGFGCVRGRKLAA